MIKLFWNTHNQKKPNTKDDKIIEELDRNYIWGIYHKKILIHGFMKFLKKSNMILLKMKQILRKMTL